MQVDGNAFTRKQGLFVLEHAVRGGTGEGGQAWQAVLHLLALLEDFALHLIKVDPSCCIDLCDKHVFYIVIDMLSCLAAAMSQVRWKVHDVHAWKTAAASVQQSHVSVCTVWLLVDEQC